MRPYKIETKDMSAWIDLDKIVCIHHLCVISEQFPDSRSNWWGCPAAAFAIKTTGGSIEIHSGIEAIHHDSISAIVDMRKAHTDLINAWCDVLPAAITV